MQFELKTKKKQKNKRIMTKMKSLFFECWLNIITIFFSNKIIIRYYISYTGDAQLGDIISQLISK